MWVIFACICSVNAVAACSSFSAAEEPNVDVADAGPQTDQGSVDDDARSGPAPCYVLLDRFDTNVASDVWSDGGIEGDASMVVQNGRLIAAVDAKAGGRAVLLSELSPVSCAAQRVELRFRAGVTKPPAPAQDLTIANEIKWPAVEGSNPMVLQFRYNDSEGSFVYQEQNGDNSTTTTVASCLVDETQRDYAITLDFSKGADPFRVRCDGMTAGAAVPLRPTHVARPFFLQAGIPYAPNGPSRIEIDSIEVSAFP